MSNEVSTSTSNIHRYASQQAERTSRKVAPARGGHAAGLFARTITCCGASSTSLLWRRYNRAEKGGAHLPKASQRRAARRKNANLIADGNPAWKFGGVRNAAKYSGPDPAGTPERDICSGCYSIDPESSLRRHLKLRTRDIHSTSRRRSRSMLRMKTFN